LIIRFRSLSLGEREQERDINHSVVSD